MYSETASLNLPAQTFKMIFSKPLCYVWFGRFIYYFLTLQFRPLPQMQLNIYFFEIRAFQEILGE